MASEGKERRLVDRNRAMLIVLLSGFVVGMI